MSTRNFQPGDAYGVGFTVKNSAGALAAADSLPVGALYHNGTADGAVAVTVSSSATGVYQASCTIPSGYSVGDRVSLLITATIGGVATGEFIDHARLVGFPNNALPNAQAGAANGVAVFDASMHLNGCKLDASDTTAANVATNLTGNAYALLAPFAGTFLPATVTAVASASTFNVRFTGTAPSPADLAGLNCNFTSVDLYPAKVPIDHATTGSGGTLVITLSYAAPSPPTTSTTVLIG